tara:strand:+ start:595 stop:1485 length:891 start_codon:yes stop_codon:yes gene_type:complete
MEKDQVVILEKRGVISITGQDADNFLQNIITNDIKKVSQTNSLFAALLTAQGKYLNEFFIIKGESGYLLDCAENSTNELIDNLSKYKLKSKIEIKDLSSKYIVAIINSKKFEELQKETNSNDNTIYYRGVPIFCDSRNKKLGARIFSNIEKFYLTIKKLNLKIIDNSNYHSLAYKLGIPVIGLENLKDQLFGLEANFEEHQALDFNKGCYIGQENTARMKLKKKLRRRLLPIKSSQKLNIGDELIYDGSKIGTVMISGEYPFALIKLFNPDFDVFKDQEVKTSRGKVKIINNHYIL